MLKKTLESPIDSKEIQSINPKENQSWIFIGRTDAEAETLILWLPDAKNGFIRNYPDMGQDWRQEEKGTTEDEMVGCHHQLNGHEFEQAPGVSDGQGSLACCSPWGLKESDMTEWLGHTHTHTHGWNRCQKMEHYFGKLPRYLETALSYEPEHDAEGPLKSNVPGATCI